MLEVLLHHVHGSGEHHEVAPPAHAVLERRVVRGPGGVGPTALERAGARAAVHIHAGKPDVRLRGAHRSGERGAHQAEAHDDDVPERSLAGLFGMRFDHGTMLPFLQS